MHKWLWSYCGTALVIGVVIAAENVWHLDKSDWASWVQAVGSIAAIIGAFMIGERQASAARKVSIQEIAYAEGKRLVQYAAIVSYAGDVAQDVKKATMSNPVDRIFYGMTVGFGRLDDYSKRCELFRSTNSGRVSRSKSCSLCARFFSPENLPERPA